MPQTVFRRRALAHAVHRSVLGCCHTFRASGAERLLEKPEARLLLCCAPVFLGRGRFAGALSRRDNGLPVAGRYQTVAGGPEPSGSDVVQRLSGRYADWATAYLNSCCALTINKWDVAGTGWPMFGSVFFLVTASELQEQGLVDARRGKVRKSVEKAHEIVVSSDTAAWVKARWGNPFVPLPCHTTRMSKTSFWYSQKNLGRSEGGDWPQFCYHMAISGCGIRF